MAAIATNKKLPVRISCTGLENEILDSMWYDLIITHTRCVRNLDPGAMRNFVAPTRTEKAGLEVVPCIVEEEKGDGSKVRSSGVRRDVVERGEASSEQMVYVINLLDNMALVLGRTRVREDNPLIDWRTYEIFVTSGSGREARVLPRQASQRLQTSIKRIFVK